ncbi:MAG: hypothetical protein K8R59_15280 [Thermoanaerobaculales bacterium]|nr:hypothetical protein [Thermoanaerobaculales bacterium]
MRRLLYSGHQQHDFDKGQDKKCGHKPIAELLDEGQAGSRLLYGFSAGSDTVFLSKKIISNGDFMGATDSIRLRRQYARLRGNIA